MKHLQQLICSLCSIDAKSDIHIILYNIYKHKLSPYNSTDSVSLSVPEFGYFVWCWHCILPIICLSDTHPEIESLNVDSAICLYLLCVIVCWSDAHRALELLEDYHSRLSKTQDRALRTAIERVIRIFKSRLFQALLGKSLWHHVTVYISC